jgi:Domain of unknown function (DUF4160)
VGSKTFDGVWFISYVHDHPPPHVHGRYAETEVIIELGLNEVRFARRWDRIRPRNAKMSDVKKIMSVAAKYKDELQALWEATHG